MAKSDYRFAQVSWATSANEILEVRKKVFVVEQRFDKEVLCDCFDNDCYHILAYKGDEIIACGRLTPDGRVSKIAVLINHRGSGVGSSILTQLITLAKKLKIKNLTLNAETDLVHFYDQQSFEVDGPVYMKQGIPYQRMRKYLA
ncbi:GNAT family N-acetyltransferase [Aliikangiella sp. IMCC44653]